jgi:hypothetical protein
VSCIAYKLFRKMSDGSISPLFFDQRLRLPVGEWIAARLDLVKKGYKTRPGWHCCMSPDAPHLTEKDRVWCKIKIRDYTVEHRPDSQGGDWLIANHIKVIKELGEADLKSLRS